MKNIPRKCHFYWNNESMSWLQTLGIQSFHKQNPDWDIYLHLTTQRADEFAENTFVRSYRGEDHYMDLFKLDYLHIVEVDMDEVGLPRDSALVLGTDMFRTYILYKEGGVYSDHDVIWLKPMTEFANIDCIGDPSNFESLACFYQLTVGHHNLSIMIAERGSEYILSIIKEQRVIRFPYGDQKYSAELLNAMYPSWNHISGKFPRLIAVKYKTFYPYSTFNLKQLFKENDLTPLKSKDVMAIHWFAGNELGIEYSSKTEFPDCSMTSILKQEGYL